MPQGKEAGGGTYGKEAGPQQEPWDRREAQAQRPASEARWDVFCSEENHFWRRRGADEDYFFEHSPGG